MKKLDTVNYYNRNVKQFYDNTVAVDFTDTQNVFLMPLAFSAACILRITSASSLQGRCRIEAHAQMPSTTFDEIIDEMIANAWYSVREFHIHLSGIQSDGRNPAYKAMALSPDQYAQYMPSS